MRLIIILLTVAMTSNIMAQQKESMNSIHQFTVKDIAGADYNLAQLKGKKVLIVNVASECGLTPQYKQLQALYDQYGEKDFTIIGFPANNFGAQEPGTDAEISTFCQKNYGVTFPMMSKISVKGDDMHPLYQFLTQKSQNGHSDSEVEWNFQKYLLNDDGSIHSVVGPRTTPDDAAITDWING